jgi:hypothetical protein
MKSTFIVSVLVLILFGFSTCKKNSNNSDPANTGTCSDGILNQNETAIDCGGKCSPCATCSDGIQNQGETSIDCGGPCGLCKIKYPAIGFFGPNILRNDTITIKPGSNHNYSLMTDMPDNTSLLVVIRKLSTTGLWSYYPSSSGYAVSVYADNKQEFRANFGIKADVNLFFQGTGYAIVDIYENGASTPTRSREITWIE